MASPSSLRIGVVASRLGGTDGVSIEAETWAQELRCLGHQVHSFAGTFDAPREPGRLVPLAFFGHPDIVAINEAVFGVPGDPGERPAGLERSIESATDRLADELRAFVGEAGLDLLLAENTLAIPMHLPLGLALARLAAETGMPVLAHHHDLPWERGRFAVGCAADIIEATFPPDLPNIHHVCINTQQQEEIERRIGRTARVIPNVVDLDDIPAAADADADVRELRADLGLHEGELLVLQPTRVVPRKGIEHALELVRQLGRPARLVITGGGSDEGPEYGRHIRTLAGLLGVEVVWAADRVAERRGELPDGRRVYSLDDVFVAADLVTYPSLIEGFGRAVLAAARLRRLLVVNRYPVYDRDIRPRGFRAIEMDGFVSGETVARTLDLLDDADTRAAWADQNLELVRRWFSTEVLRHQLRAVLEDIFG